jgi:hypothetical protein
MGLASNYHSPVGYWLDLKLRDLEEYVKIAYDNIKSQKDTYQDVGPGL